MKLEFNDFRKGLDINIQEINYNEKEGVLKLTFEERVHEGWYSVSLKASEAIEVGLINPKAVYRLMADLISKE